MFILINYLIGLDALASAKRGGTHYDGGFKLPKERTISIAASAEDEDKSESTVVEESEQGAIVSTHRHTRRYRETTHAGTYIINFSLYSCFHQLISIQEVYVYSLKSSDGLFMRDKKLTKW